MQSPEQDLVKLIKLVEKLKSKAYRNAYLEGRVRGGIAYQIQALRHQLGLTQLEFAELTGKKQSVISRLESTEYGGVSVQTLLDIAIALDIAISVRFCTFPEFVKQASDVSPKSLEVSSFSDSIWENVPPQQRLTDSNAATQSSTIVLNAVDSMGPKNSTGGMPWPMTHPKQNSFSIGLSNTQKYIPIIATSASVPMT